MEVQQNAAGAAPTRGVQDLNTALAATERVVQSQGSDRGPWIQTFTGRAFHYDDPRPEDVHLVDIARALSHQCRFAGHTSHFYSVAEHSVHVARQFSDPELRLIGLLHDATEAYILDLPKPLKSLLPAYEEYEAKLWRVIAAKFGMPDEIPAVIHDIDRRMLITERPQLFRHPIPWPKYAHVQPLDGVQIEGWLPNHAQAEFLACFAEIQHFRVV